MSAEAGGADSRAGPDAFTELLARAKGGDAAAREELCRRHTKALVTRIRARLPAALRRRYDSLDLIQSVTAELLVRLGEFEDRGERAFRNWLYLAAENKIRSKWRKELDAAGLRREEPLGRHERDGARCRHPGPATDAERIDETAWAHERLGHLDERSRALIVLRVQDGLSFSQIAERVGAPSADAARMRFARALESVRALRGR